MADGLVLTHGAGHDLFRKRTPSVAETIAAAFLDFTAKLGKGATR